MDTLSFIAKLVEFLAWPLATAFAVFMLRTEIRRLLSLVRKLKAGPVEAEFEREVIELKEASQVAAPEPAGITTNISPGAREERLALVEMAEVSPRAAILEAWHQVESAADALARSELVKTKLQGKAPAVSSFRAIARAEVLPLEWVARYYELRELRNRAAHEKDFTPTLTSTIAYIELSARLKSQLIAARGDA